MKKFFEFRQFKYHKIGSDRIKIRVLFQTQQAGFYARIVPAAYIGRKRVAYDKGIFRLKVRDMFCAVIKKAFLRL